MSNAGTSAAGGPSVTLPTLICQPGEQRCGANNTAETCLNNAWTPAASPCSVICLGAGVCAECEPNSKSCDGQTPSACDSTGHWVSGAVCVDSACDLGVCRGACRPGERECGNDHRTPRFCSDAGAWQDQARCEFACVGNGDCGGSCVPNNKKCKDASTLQTCGSDGLAYQATTCQPAQKNETASCVVDTCVSVCQAPAQKCGLSPFCWNLEYGCEMCVYPYVWRGATAEDRVCVTRESNERSVQENQGGQQDTCPSPLVWREVDASDHVCVAPEIRDSVVPMENTLGVLRTVVATSSP